MTRTKEEVNKEYLEVKKKLEELYLEESICESVLQEMREEIKLHEIMLLIAEEALLNYNQMIQPIPPNSKNN